MCIFRRDGKSLEMFLEDYFANRLKKYVKTEAVPESNDGPVKVITYTVYWTWIKLSYYI